MRRNPLLLTFALFVGGSIVGPAVAGELPGAVPNSEHTFKLAPEASSPPARIEQLAWMAGYWTGTGLGGETEEMWTPPVGDRMHGIFTLRRDSELVFSEMMMFVEKDDTLVLRLKHFDADFVGWEDKHGTVDFPLVGIGEREVFFGGLTLRLEGEDQLQIYLVLARDGERSEISFAMRRRGPL